MFWNTWIFDSGIFIKISNGRRDGRRRKIKEEEKSIGDERLQVIARARPSFREETNEKENTSEGYSASSVRNFRDDYTSSLGRFFFPSCFAQANSRASLIFLFYFPYLTAHRHQRPCIRRR